MRSLLLALVATLSLPAAWNYQVISGASHGAIASRTLGGTERTYLAYRDQSGALAVATLRGGAINAQTIWPGIAPSNTHVSISVTDSVIVTFWSADKFRFATLVGAGNGNCGPYSNWRCGDILLPAGVSAVKLERVVASVDSIARIHFFYALRTYSNTIPNPTNGLYYTARTATGFWSTPTKVENPNALPSPTGVEVGIGLTSPIYLMTVAPNFHTSLSAKGFLGGPGLGEPVNLELLPDTNSSNVTHAEMDPVNEPLVSCFSKGPGLNTSHAHEIGVLRRTPSHANFSANIHHIVYNGLSAPYPPTNGCSLRVRSNGLPYVAYSTTQNIVYVATPSYEFDWSAPWNVDIVDASGSFSNPRITLSGAQKRYVLYQGKGFLKFAREL